jgi:alpha-tubulin suppressor-like RCC1 family protein
MRRAPLLCLMFVLGCTDEPTLPAPELIEIVSGGDQLGGQRIVLAAPVVIRLLRDGQPRANVAVDWRVIEGGGTILKADTRTDAQGLAQATWELGASAGQNLLYVAAPGGARTIRATAQRHMRMVTAGARHTCALSTLGEAFCWGANHDFQLGDGTNVSRSTPAAVRGNLRFRDLAAGSNHTCGLTDGDNVYCWGSNGEGQVGFGRTQSHAGVPVPVAGNVAFTSVSAGFVHSCAVASTGEVYCWGGNAQRQLGTGSTQSSNVPIKVASTIQFKQVSTGEFHSCGVAIDNVAYCWGWSSTGEVGDGGAFNTFHAQPARVAGGINFRSITAGVRHTCAIAVSGAAYCWGRSAAGEIGTPQFHHYSTPIRIPGALTFDLIGAGNVHSCGTGTNPQSSSPGQRAVYCWGSDGFNHAGETPRAIFTSPEAALAVGYEHTCTVQTGFVWCWGSNVDGRLGVPAISGSAVPVKVMLPGQR